MASAFEITSDYSHEILDRIKSNPPRPSSSSSSSSSSLSKGNNYSKTFANSKKKPKNSNDIFSRRNDALNLKGLTEIANNNNLYRLLMPKTKQNGPISLSSASARSNSLIQQKHYLSDKYLKARTSAASSSSRNNLKSYQTPKHETPPSLLNSISLFEKSPNTKQSLLKNINDEHIAILDDVDILPLHEKSALFTSIEAIGLVGIIFAAVVLVCWIKKFILSFVNKKSSVKIEKKPSNQTKAKRIISVLRKSFVLRRPIVVSTIMDTNAETDQLNDRSNNDSNKSTPYFTPLGTFDDDRSRFEYPVPPLAISSCRSGGKVNSNEELLLLASNADSVQNTLSRSKTSAIVANTTNTTSSTIISTESPARRFSTERRPCSPAWSYMAHLLTTNQVCNKSQYDTYDNLYAAGSSPLYSAMSFNSSRPSPPASASAVEGGNLMNRQSCRSPKVYDKEGDKENEIPTKAIHKQQNSPLAMEVPRLASTKFSFSPKDINDKSSSTAVPADGKCVIKSSPTLSSAGYTKNGDYFKFPEVDLFSPGIINKTNNYRFENQNDDELQLELSYPSNNLLQQHDKLKVKSSSAASDTQASRRARLKSISLDSEGAKLVEDNLGVPVEELIEMSTPTLMSSDFIGTSPNTNNTIKNISNLKNLSISNSERDQFEGRDDDADDSCCFEDTNDEPYGMKSNNKSNNLSLKVLWYNDVNQNSHREPIIQTPPPKTPTLGKTKQKAISFDSSDSSKLLPSLSSMSQRSQDRDQNDALNDSHVETSPAKAVSLMHISSLSMPGTPKRNFSPNKKYNHVVNRINRTKQRQLSSNITLTPSTPSLSSSFDSTKCAERQGFILKLDSFNENCIDDVDYGDVELGVVDDDGDGESYFINYDDSSTGAGAATSNANKLLHHDYDTSNTPAIKKLSPDYLIGSNLQTQKCATVLSLSNSNLKTLPEVMTLSDFSVGRQADEIYGDTLNTSSSVALAASAGGGGAKQSNLLNSRSAARSSLLQRRGSNHSLTLNLNESYGSLNKGLSASNYSLCSNSQYNLSNSIYNLTGSKQQAVLFKGNSIGIASTFIHNGNNLINQASGGFGGNQGNLAEKKNLLQRRGSNTSLTLNIHGSSYVHLNRFKSHSSLNITSHPTQQQNLFKIQQQQQQQQQQQHHTIKDPILNETSPNSKTSNSKKGLLERRGSNASLTINLQCNALAVSNLRGSACSLSSINTNQLEEEYANRGNQHSDFLDADAKNSVCVGQQRKFFSSENLNNLNNRSQYSKLNQTHMRNSTKTCFGSVSDLNNYSQLPISSNDSETETILPTNTTTTTLHINQTTSSSSNSKNLTLSKTKQQALPESLITNFEQSNLCSCTGLRNITTRPLSPQTTSEDFKMYLANVQLLQNASNVLDGYDLMKLNYVFEKSYNDDNHHHNDKLSGDVETNDEQNQWKVILSSFFKIDFPDENEQKRLIRSLHQEFWDLPTNHQEKPMVFGSQSKNRYKSILPNEHSRVQLIAEEGCIEAPYINANYIKGPDYVQKSYIATQGPLPNTIYDFWLMIFQNICKYDEQQKCIGSPKPYCKNTSSNNKLPSSPIEFDKISESFLTGTTTKTTFKNKQQKIIMLTNFVENNRQKCATYFPINENDIFLITYTNDEIMNNDIKIFYNEYFKKHETSSSNYDTFEIEINDKKIIDYLPKVNYVIVKNKGIIIKNGFSIRQLQCLFCCNVSNKPSSNVNENAENESSKENTSDGNVKRIQIVHSFSSLHYWYPDWPDHRSPSDISVLLEISQHLLTWDNSNDQPLPVIHCSAGIGRTGCMAAILNAISQIRASFPLKSINAYQHEETPTTSPTITTTTPTTAIACGNNSNNIIQSSMSDVDNLQSFSSQSFPYSNNSSNNSNNKIKNSNLNITKIIQSPTESNDDKNRIQSIVNLKDGFSSSCSSSNVQTKNNVYCEMTTAATAAIVPIIQIPSIHVDILGIVCNLRLQRGGMVQNSEQYELIHRAMCLYLKRVLKLIYEAQI